MLSVEIAGRLIAGAVRKVPITRSGLSLESYLESRLVGYEKDATSDAKQEARRDAIDHGKLTAEDFDSAFAATPKSLYVDAEAALAQSLEALDRLDEYQQEAYGENAPILTNLRGALAEVHQAVTSLLNERRKTDPDPVKAPEQSSALPTAEQGGAASVGAQQSFDSGESSFGDPIPRRTASSGSLTGMADAYGLVVESAEFLFQRDPQSPVPYLICAGPSARTRLCCGTKPRRTPIAARPGQSRSLAGSYARNTPHPRQRVRPCLDRSAPIHLASRTGNGRRGNLRSSRRNYQKPARIPAGVTPLDSRR